MMRKLLQSILARSEWTFARIKPFLINALEFGEGTQISRGSIVRAFDGGRIHFGKDVFIGQNSRIIASGGLIEIGDYAFIGHGCTIVSMSKICIGRDALIAEYVTIRDQNHVFDGDGLIRNLGFSTQDIDVGENVWIGAKATILPGITIGNGCVVGAGSVVSSDIAENSIAVGVPARIIRERKSNDCKDASVVK